MTTKKTSQSAPLPQPDATLIRQVPLFSQLTDAQAGQIAASSMRRRFRKGELMIERGRKSDALFIVLSGRAHVAINEESSRLKFTRGSICSPAGSSAEVRKPRKPRVPGEPQEVIVAILHPGDHFGEMSMIDGSPHSANVRAEVAIEVLMLGRSDFMRCLAENLAMTYSIMKSLAHRLRRADAKIQSLALMDVYGRVAHTLLDLAVIDTETGEGRIGERLSRQYLAKTVGASREMVSRVMKDLENRGFITEYENRTTVLRPNLFMAQ
jgi:CRP-like cAMP-binding protein